MAWPPFMPGFGAHMNALTPSAVDSSTITPFVPITHAGITNAPTSGTFAKTDTVHAEIALTNTGERKGTEVVQVYIGDIVTSYSWTDRELKAFQRVELEPGQTKTVGFDIPVADCTIVDPDANRIVEPGEFEVLIGHSSRRKDLKRTTFTVA